MLYCSTCGQVVPKGFNQCGNCNNGFVSKLACGNCGKEVPSGAGSCARCEPPQAEGVLVLGGAPSALPRLPAALTTFHRPAAVPDVYRAGKLGANARVTMGGRDAEILTRLGDAAVLLQALAVELNGLQGHMASTRTLIKGCRTLSADMQEEIETRLGPQG